MKQLQLGTVPHSYQDYPVCSRTPYYQSLLELINYAARDQHRGSPDPEGTIVAQAGKYTG